MVNGTSSHIGGEDAQTKLAAKKKLNFIHSSVPWAVGMQKLQVLGLVLVPIASASAHYKPPGENFTT